MVLSIVLLMAVKWVSHCTVLSDTLGYTELTEGNVLGALEGGFDGLSVYWSIDGSNIKSNLVLNILLRSYLKVAIGSPKGTVDDTVDGLIVGISLGTCDWWHRVVQLIKGTASILGGWLWWCSIAATYHWTWCFAWHATWLFGGFHWLTRRYCPWYCWWLEGGSLMMYFAWWHAGFCRTGWRVSIRDVQ